MVDQTKKCPMCAEEIKAEAKICRYCQTQFEVVERGYCSNCHQVVRGSGNGKCGRCGGDLLDKHTESLVVQKEREEAGVEKPTESVSEETLKQQPQPQPEPRPKIKKQEETKKQKVFFRRWSLGGLFVGIGILFLLVIIGFFGLKWIRSQVTPRQWKFKTGGEVLSSPAVANGVVYFGSLDKNVYALDAKTGQEKWRFKTESNGKGKVAFSPATYGGLVYFVSGERNLYAVDAETGKERWRFNTEGPLTPWLTVYDGIVYCGIGGSFKAYAYALDAKTGEEKWKREVLYDVSSIAPYGRTVCLASYDLDEDEGIITAYLCAVDAKTGNQRWKLELGRGFVVSCSEVVDGTVYLGSDKGSLYAVEAKSGNLKWEFEGGEEIPSPPTVASGVVYFASHGDYLYAVDAKSGEQRWRFKAGGVALSSPTVADGIVYFGSWDKNVYALDAKTGREKGRFKAESPVFSSPAIVDGIVYFGSRDGNLYAVPVESLVKK